MKTEIYQLLVETKEANKKVAALEKQITDLKKVVEKTGKDSAKGFKGLTGALGKVSKGFKDNNFCSKRSYSTHKYRCLSTRN